MDGTGQNVAAGGGGSAAASSDSAIPYGLYGLVAAASYPVTQPATPAPAASHWYADDPAGDAYWSKQPEAVQQLREINDPDERMQLGTELAAQGYNIDVPIMVWGWDAGKTTELRQSYGYTWVPGMMQQPVTAAPGITAPGLTPYDPSHPPAGSIMV